MATAEQTAQHTAGPWGIEQTRDTLWIGPMRQDGHKVDGVVVGLGIDSDLTQAAALRQYRNARLIAAAPDMLEALEHLLKVREREGVKPQSRNAAEAKARAAIAKARGQ